MGRISGSSLEVNWCQIRRVDLTTGLSVKPEGLSGREDVRKALREYKLQECVSSLHYGVSEDLSQ